MKILLPFLLFFWFDGMTAQSIQILDKDSEKTIGFVAIQDKNKQLLGYTNKLGLFLLDGLQSESLFIFHPSYQRKTISFPKQDTLIYLTAKHIELNALQIVPLPKKGKITTHGKRMNNFWMTHEIGSEYAFPIFFAAKQMAITELRFYHYTKSADEIPIKITFYDFTENGPGQEQKSIYHLIPANAKQRDKSVIKLQKPLIVRGSNAYIGFSYVDKFGKPYRDEVRHSLGFKVKKSSTKKVYSRKPLDGDWQKSDFQFHYDWIMKVRLPQTSKIN